MTQRSLRIVLSPEQTARLLDWAGRRTAAEADADCEPSGYTLEVDVSSYGCSATAKNGNATLDLGDVDVALGAEA